MTMGATMSAGGISWLSEPSDWSRLLDDAQDVDDLRRKVSTWMPYVPDALSVANQMKPEDWAEWRRGLKSERAGVYSGDEWMERFGALVLPAAFILATEVRRRFRVPLGAALIRLEESRLILNPRGKR